MRLLNAKIYNLIMHFLYLHEINFNYKEFEQMVYF